MEGGDRQESRRLTRVPALTSVLLRCAGSSDDPLAIAARYGAHNVRVFGSVTRGETDEASDIDSER